MNVEAQGTQTHKNETQGTLYKVYNDNRLSSLEEYFQMFSEAIILAFSIFICHSNLLEVI